MQQSAYSISTLLVWIRLHVLVVYGVIAFIVQRPCPENLICITLHASHQQQTGRPHLYQMVIAGLRVRLPHTFLRTRPQVWRKAQSASSSASGRGTKKKASGEASRA